MTGSFFLAQSLYSTQDPAGTRNTLIVIGVFAAIAVVIAIAKRRSGLDADTGPNPEAGPQTTTAKGAKGREGFDRGGFRKAAREAGLVPEEIRFLEEYARLLGVRNPAFLFGNRVKLDDFFREVFKSIEQYAESESGAEERKAALFKVREHLNQSQKKGGQVTSSRQLGRNLPLSFLVKGEESYPSTVVEVDAKGLTVEPPRDSYGQVLRLKRGTKLTCFFYAPGKQGYQFDTRVAGWELSGALDLMRISHSDSVRALPARRHERRDIKAPCSFYRVAVTMEGARGHEKKKAKVEKMANAGTIADISAGGIGVMSYSPLAPGDFIKIEFDTGGGIQTAFGKVVRVNKLRNSGGLMHIQFVKITRRSLNAILSFVYGYSEQ
jgi:c-di-GMP-binding flagellar brake protein YcgR